MPLLSQRQRRWMFANHPEMAKRWAAHTPAISELPESVDKADKDEQQEKTGYVRDFFLKLASGPLAAPAGSPPASPAMAAAVQQSQQQTAALTQFAKPKAPPASPGVMAAAQPTKNPFSLRVMTQRMGHSVAPPM